MPKPIIDPEDEWISARQVAQRLHIGGPSVVRVCTAGGVRTRTLPGLDRRFNSPRYNGADVARLATSTIRLPEPPDDRQAVSA